jgi:hypothetical protein
VSRPLEPISTEAFVALAGAAFGLPNMARLVTLVNRWLDRGDAAAIYVRPDVYRPDDGLCKIASYGWSDEAYLAGSVPPNTLPGEEHEYVLMHVFIGPPIPVGMGLMPLSQESSPKGAQLMATKQMSPDELTRFVGTHLAKDEVDGHFVNINRWLGRGDWVAIYEATDRASGPTCRLVSVGSPRSMLGQRDEAPTTLAGLDNIVRRGDDYQLTGIYTGPTVPIPTEGSSGFTS